MRDFKNMKRQRGRNRGGGGGGGKPQHNANRAFDSNGPDNVKIRGHAQHVFEKYQQLARDAFSSGDRVLAENYLQHADHYFRVLRTIQPQRPPSEILGRDVLASGLDIDFEEEFEAGEEAGTEMGGEGQAETGAERSDVQGQGRREFQEGRDVRGERSDRYETRSDREGYNRDRQEGRDRQDRYDRGERGDRFERNDRGERYEGRRDRFEGRREDRPFNREARETRSDERRAHQPAEPARDPLAATTPEGAPQPYVDMAPAAAVEVAPTLRAEDGGVSEAPAFLHPVAEGEARRPRARRRRAPRSFDTSAEGGPEADASAPEVEEA